MAIIPLSRRITWALGTTQGVEGGIPAQTQTIFQTLASSSTAAQINTAIQNCPAGQVVKLGSGTFSLSATIVMKTGVVLRGSGMGTTILDPSHNNTIIELINGSDVAGSGTNISAGRTKGSTSVTVASNSGLSVGQLVRIEQPIDTADMWVAQSTNTGDDTISRSVAQNCIITAISGTTITFKPPLNHATSSGTASLRPFDGKITDVGLEDFSIDGTGQTTVWGVMTVGAVNCWFSNIKTTKINNFHFYNLGALFCEWRKCWIDDSPDYEPNHGGIVLGNVGGDGSTPGGGAMAGYTATNCAVYDCIFDKVLPGVEVNGGSSGCVIAYNYFRDARYGPPPGGSQAGGLNINHGGTNCMNLYEGNFVNQIQSDAYFGGSYCDTIFRNWSTGWTETYADYNMKCIDLNKWTINANVIGNVLGYSTIVPDYLSVNFNGSGYDDSTIYRFGFPNGGNGDYTGTRPASTDRVNALDLNVEARAGIHGNWEKFTQTQTWAADDTNVTDHTDHTIPDSLYLSGKPSWFFGLTWPPVNPANGLTGLSVDKIPAGYRYLNSNADPPAGGSSSLTVTSFSCTTLMIG